MTRDADALGKSGHGTPSRSLPTPGPWTLHPRVTMDPPHVYASGVIVCTVDTSAPDAGEREANARLIAAAPDLLLAVELLMEHVETWYGGDDEPTARKPLKAARAAIAKATGTGG